METSKNTVNDVLAILAPAASGVVSASAGTGKTWLLVSRMLRLLLDGSTPASILAITFTNKAADEMRERLMARLLQWSEAGGDELRASLGEIGVRDAENHRARAANLYETLLYAPETVQITTFHAFCQQILRLFPMQTDAPLNFQVAEALEGPLRVQAVDELFRRAAQDDDDCARALDTLFDLCNGVENARIALDEFLRHRNDWQAYIRGGGEKPRLTDGDGDGDELLGQFWSEGLRERIARYAELIAKHKTKTNPRKAGQLRALAAHATLDRETFGELRLCFFRADGEARSEPSGQPLIKALGREDATWVGDAHHALVDAIREAREQLLQRDNERLNAAWYRAGERLCEIYANLKRDGGLLDFDDLEFMGEQLLRDGCDPQERLANRIEHVLIDEFQDTNPTQWLLLRPLLDEIVSRAGGSLFIVGDVKQSIYGFRRADPELQQTAADWLRRKRPDGLHPTMNKSRRSARAVITFINRVFGGGAPPQDAATQDAATPVGFAAHDTFCETEGGVRVFELHEAQKTPEQSWRDPLREPRAEAQSAPRAEAEQIADTILRLQKNRLPIEEDGEVRPFRWRDAMILARQTTHYPVFLQALRVAGVPSVSAREQNFLTSLEASDLIALLEFLRDPYRDDALAQVLRSPIYSLDDDRLLALARAPGTCWRARLAGLAASCDRDREAWRRIARQLQQWEEWYDRLPPHDLLDRIYHEADLVRRYRASVPEQERDRVHRNLDSFLEYTLDFDSGRYPGGARLSAHLQNARRLAGGRADAAAADDGDCVRLMSIHGAKGLEAPVVFLVDCAFRRSHKETYRALVNWPPARTEPCDVVLLPVAGERGRVLRELAAERKRREQREDANLLYVGLTRAKQYLFVSANGKADKTNWYQRLRAAIGDNGLLGADAVAHTDARVRAAPDADADAAQEAQETAVPATPIAATVAAPRIASERNPSRMVRSGDFAGARVHSPGHKDGALRGEVIHRALELLNTRACDDFDALRRRLAAEHRAADGDLVAWAREAWDLVREPRLSELFDDELYQRVFNEMPLLYRRGDERIFGTLDRLCVGADAVWLVDYKTHRRYDPKKLIEDHREQMSCYRDGVAGLYPGRKLRVSLLMTVDGQLCDC